MSKTAEEYMGEIRLALGTNSDDTSLFPTEKTLWALNAGLRQITTEREWPWLFKADAGNTVTVADDPLLPLPADHIRTVYLNVNNQDVEPASAREAAQYRDQDAGYPSLYSVEGANIRLSPKPVAGLVVDHAYFCSEPTVTLTNQELLIPDTYSDWVVAASAAKLAVRTNNLQRLEVLRGEYTYWLGVAQDNVRRSGGTPRQRMTRSSVWPEYDYTY